MLKTVCYDTPMKYRLAYVTLCLAMGASGAWCEDEPKPGAAGGGGGGDGRAGSGGMGGAGGMGGMGGTGGATDGPRETNPTDGPMTEGGTDGAGMPMATVSPAGKRLTSAD